jgi:hypothetical protein
MIVKERRNNRDHTLLFLWDFNNYRRLINFSKISIRTINELPYSS